VVPPDWRKPEFFTGSGTIQMRSLCRSSPAPCNLLLYLSGGDQSLASNHNRDPMLKVDLSYLSWTWSEIYKLRSLLDD
jgi:hypothetical protein